MKTCCIYIIEAVAGNPSKIGWKNVGQTENYEVRLKEHFRLLKRGKHHSPKLQRYYNKYGRQSLQYYILKICTKEELGFWEQFFIRSFESFHHGFNCTEGEKDITPKRKVPCVMQNIFSGEIVQYPSLSAFARNHGVSDRDVSSVVSGKRGHVKGWICPNNKWKPKFYTILSPEGQEMKVFKANTFLKQHNLPISSAFLNMLKGRRPSWYGYSLKKETL